MYAEQLTWRTDYQAVFAFPLLAAARPLDSLSFCRRSPGPL